MESSPYLLRNEASDPCFAFDCVNLFDREMQGVTRFQNAWLEAVAQSNLDALQLGRQALWFVPSMYLFDSFGQVLAKYVELQTGIQSLLMKQAKVAATLQVEFATASLGVAASALSRAMDVAIGAAPEGQPELDLSAEISAEATAAAA